jgi:hypothetical protein
MKFKIGDVVRILGKTTGFSLEHTINICGDKGYIDKIGYIEFAGEELYTLTKYPAFQFRSIDLEIADHQERLNRKYGYEV